jgi:hypothetical protein
MMASELGGRNLRFPAFEISNRRANARVAAPRFPVRELSIRPDWSGNDRPPGKTSAISPPVEADGKSPRPTPVATD